MDLAGLARALGSVTVAVTDGGGIGSGLVWSPDRVVTNAHVVSHARVRLRRFDDRTFQGRVVAHDRQADLALLDVPDLGLPAAPCADGVIPSVGSLIVAVGHPHGLPNALTAGIVHAYGPLVPGGRPWLQADLRLAPGNSGGPLADARGQVLGISAMIIGSLALAIPVGQVRDFVCAAGVSSR
jgi:serine protease Do